MRLPLHEKLDAKNQKNVECPRKMKHFLRRNQMIIKETDQHHQNNADAESNQLSAIQLGRGILYSDQSAIIECTDQCDQQIIKFSERKSL